MWSKNQMASRATFIRQNKVSVANLKKWFLQSKRENIWNFRFGFTFLKDQNYNVEPLMCKLAFFTNTLNNHPNVLN